MMNKTEKEEEKEHNDKHKRLDEQQRSMINRDLNQSRWR